MGTRLLICAGGGAIAVDVLTLQYGVPYINFTNFAFVWLAVHQLGHAWSEDYFAKPSRAVLTALAGLIAFVLVLVAAYMLGGIGLESYPGTSG